MNTDNAESINLCTDPSPIRPRKLRKVKPNYQQLRCEPLSIENVEPVRPESIVCMPSPPTNHPALSTERRAPRKLEKRGKASSTTTFLPFGVSTWRDGLQDSPTSSTRSADALLSQSQFSQAVSSIGTDELVSLAWTGELQTQIPGLDSAENLSQSNCDSNLSQFTSAIAQVQPQPRIKPMHTGKQRKYSFLRFPTATGVIKDPPSPWSFAMAVTDDKITDETLVDQLEDMRVKKQPQRASPLSAWVACPSTSYQAVLQDLYTEYPPEPDEFFMEDESSELSWNAARQALLLCREILRTERRYLAALRTLARWGGTATPPPATMLCYLPRLMAASDGFIQSMTKNPSVQGVSEAFLASQKPLHDGFVSWCGIVGAFFSQDDDGKLKTDSEDSFGALRRMSSFPPADAKSMDIVVIGPNKIRRNTKVRPSVRDLAILPTQRIVRYVLLFKELHALTPTTMSSASIVAEALRVAQFIAQKSDEAQEHSAFKIPEI